MSEPLSAQYRIDRCQCTGRSFAELRQLCRERGWSEATLRQLTGAGNQCKHCRPFLQQALASELDAVPLPDQHPQWQLLIRHFRLRP